MDPNGLPAAEAARARTAASFAAARAAERRRMTRGLLILGLAILLASIAHAGLHRVFYPGWWRQW